MTPLLLAATMSAMLCLPADTQSGDSWRSRGQRC
jgi:hypothetical protein